MKPDISFPLKDPWRKALLMEYVNRDESFRRKLEGVLPFCEPDFDGMYPNGRYMVRCLIEEDLLT
jgi:hypothetical protein